MISVRQNFSFFFHFQPIFSIFQSFSSFLYKVHLFSKVVTHTPEFLWHAFHTTWGLQSDVATWLNYCRQGSHSLWKTWNNWKIDFYFSRQGKLREFDKTSKNSGKTQGIWVVLENFFSFLPLSRSRAIHLSHFQNRRRYLFLYLGSIGVITPFATFHIMEFWKFFWKTQGKLRKFCHPEIVGTLCRGIFRAPNSRHLKYGYSSSNIFKIWIDKDVLFLKVTLPSKDVAPIKMQSSGEGKLHTLRPNFASRCEYHDVNKMLGQEHFKDIAMWSHSVGEISSK